MKRLVFIVVLLLPFSSFGEESIHSIIQNLENRSYQRTVRTITRAISRYSKEQICDDFQIFVFFNQYIHPPTHDKLHLWEKPEQLSNASLIDDKCPRNLIELGKAIYDNININNDLHDEADIYDGLGMRETHIVKDVKILKCSNHCQENHHYLTLTGGQLYYLQEYLYHGFYVLLSNPHKQSYAFEILKLNDQFLTKNDSFEVFSKSMLTDFELADATLLLRNIQNDDILEIRLTYKLRKPLFSFNKKIKQLAFNAINLDFHYNFYNCDIIIPGSSGGVGACLNQNGIGVVWQKSLANSDSIHFLRKLLKKFPLVLKYPLILDISFNGGGDTLSALKMACVIGDKTVYDAIFKRKLYQNRIPDQLITKNGHIYQSKKLMVYKDSKVSMYDKTAVIDFRQPIENSRLYNIISRQLYSLQGLDIKWCQSASLKGLRWYILTSGQEFSAAETFLSLVKNSSHITIIGSKTLGGTGHPLKLELPNTKINISLSQARQFATDELEPWVIENQGINPDIEVEFDLRKEFELRLIYYLENENLDNYQSVPNIYKYLKTKGWL